MEWRIECTECENTTILNVDIEPEFCPCCGRRGEAELISEPIDFDNFDDDVISPDGC